MNPPVASNSPPSPAPEAAPRLNSALLSTIVVPAPAGVSAVSSAVSPTHPTAPANAASGINATASIVGIAPVKGAAIRIAMVTVPTDTMVRVGTPASGPPAARLPAK